MTLRLRIAVAENTATKREDLPAVLGLIEDARKWLPTKGTDQWAMPYPDADGKLARVQEGIERGETLIVWDGKIAAATVTIKTERNDVVWSEQTTECNLSEPAVYVHRLITARKYAGLGLGAELIDWAGLWGYRSYRAEWVRLDVWTTNLALHKYYIGTGFESCGTYQDDPLYRSGALFQKPVAAIEAANLHIPHFTGSAANFVLPDTRPARPGRADQHSAATSAGIRPRDCGGLHLAPERGGRVPALGETRGSLVLPKGYVLLTDQRSVAHPLEGRLPWSNAPKVINKIRADSAASRQPLNLIVTYGLPYLILDLTGDGQPRHSHDLFGEGAVVAEVRGGETHPGQARRCHGQASLPPFSAVPLRALRPIRVTRRLRANGRWRP